MGISDFASRFTTRASWYIYTRLRANIRRNLTYEYLWAASAKSSAKYIEDNIDSAVVYPDRMAFWRFVLNKIPASGAIIEVGVYKGRSVNFIADHLSRVNDSRPVDGFDSFEGLEEDWSGESMAGGYFELKGELPKVRPRVRLHKGWIEDTLEPFLTEFRDGEIALLHIDTDTYSPAYCALKTCLPFLREGSVIVFDELVGYPNWQAHEARALREVMDRSDYEFISFTSRQAAIRMRRMPSGPTRVAEYDTTNSAGQISPHIRGVPSLQSEAKDIDRPPRRH